MSELIWVSPQSYLLSENDWQSTLKKSGYIPILKADLTKFQQSLQQALKSKNVISNNQLGSLTGETTGTKSNEIDEPKGSEVSKYKPIDQFLQKNKPLSTFTIRSLVYIESTSKLELLLINWINYMKSQIKDTAHNNSLNLESWSRIFATGFDTQDIFVRMSIPDGKDGTDIMLYRFLDLFKKISDHSDKFSINFDENVSNLITEKLSRSEINEPDLYDISQHLNSVLDEFITSNSNSTQNNDTQSKNISTDEYHIDLSTLSDLPRESLDQLCKDIMEFRSRVITIERERIMKENVEENERRRQKMIQMFEDIHEKQNPNKVSADNMLITDVGEDEAFSYPDDSQFDEDNDGLAAEQKSVEKKQLEAKNRYNKLLHKLNSTIDPRVKTLEIQLSKAENYDTNLGKIRPVAVKELLHLGEDMYYDFKRSYRKDEELLDDKNRDKYGSDVSMPPLIDEVSSGPTNEPKIDTMSGTVKPLVSSPSKKDTETTEINITLNFNKAVGSSKQDRADEENLETVDPDQPSEQLSETSSVEMANNTPTILPYGAQELDNKLRRLRDSKLVDELIKEYLGVYEEELVDYIFVNIKEYKNKGTLLEELKETFDEDAIVIVNKIWNSEAFAP